MDIKEIENYLNENKENEDVKGLIKSFQTPIDRDVVENWCKEGQGKSWRDSICDIYSQKAVNTARENALEKFKKEELPKLNEEYYKSKTGEGLTDEQKQMKELQDKIAKMENEKLEDEILNTYRKKLKEANLSQDLAKYTKNDEDVEFFKNLINTSNSEAIKSKLGNCDYNPPKETLTGGKISWGEVENNPELYSQWKKENN